MAVFTKVGKLAFEEFAAAYEIAPPFQLSPITEGIENTNYRASAGGCEYVLTLLEGRSRDINTDGYAECLEYLGKQGLPVPQPVRTLKGSSSRLLSGKPALLVSWLPGHSTASPNRRQCALAGQALAKLHIAGLGLKNVEPNKLGVDSWQSYFETFSERREFKGTSAHHALAEGIENVETQWPTDLPRGLIHADFFPDNLLFDHGVVSGLLDFYYACQDFLAYDLAIALTAWCGPAKVWPQPNLLEAFLEGYESVRTIEASERGAMPILLQGACIRFALTRFHDWIAPPINAMVTKKDPAEYLLKFEAAKAWMG